MKWIQSSRRIAGPTLSLCIGFSTGALVTARADAQQPAGITTTETITIDHLPEGVEVLMRGPVHQAFAQPYPKNEEMTRIDRPVPAPLHERPAAARPSDPERTAQWIPGYWAIDPDNESFLWVSGIWRFPPPGMQWVPGYWDTHGTTSTWVSGFWVDDRIEELEFVARPPEPRETMPVDQPPSEKHFWVPGYWVFENGDFAWEPGTWGEAQQGWVWEPARYLQTPGGWVFVDGYWDYEPADRGLLFAPVRFDQASIQITQEVRRPVVLEETYWPQVAIEPRYAMQHWFAQPAYTHYYFGNYYDPRFAQSGLVPWVGYQTQPTYYDPLFWYFRAAQPTFLSQLIQTRNRVIAQPSLQPAAVFSTNIAAGQLPSYVQTVDTLLTGDRANQYTRVEESVLDDYSKRLQQYDTFTEEQLSVRAKLGDEGAARAQTEARAQGSIQRGDTPESRTRDAASADAAATDQPRDGQDRRMRTRSEEASDATAQPGVTTPDRPRTETPDQPGADTPDRPKTGTPDRPRTEAPGKPGTPDRPGAAPDKPGATPDKPGPTPDKPGTPDRPGAPDRPGVTPDKPGATPDKPGTPTRPDRPGTPDRPSASADRPTTPERPDAATDRPRDMRRGERADSRTERSENRLDLGATPADPREGTGATPRPRSQTDPRPGAPADPRPGAPADPRPGAPASPRASLDTDASLDARGSDRERPSQISGAAQTRGTAEMRGLSETAGSGQSRGTRDTRELSETAGSGQSRGTRDMRALSETAGSGNQGGLNATTAGEARSQISGAAGGELPSQLLQRRQAEQASQLRRNPEGLSPNQRMSLDRLRQIQMPEGLPRAQGVPQGQRPRFTPPQRIGRPSTLPSRAAGAPGLLQGGSVPESQVPPDL